MGGALHCVKISITTSVDPQLHDYNSNTRTHWNMNIRETFQLPRHFLCNSGREFITLESA